MTSVPTLKLPDISKNFIVETIAFGFSLGTILMQDQHSIAFFSQTLGPQAWKKSIYEKELMSIVFAVAKWRSYLRGRKFIMRTNQHRLKFLLLERVIDFEYQKWVLKLMGINFDIEYRSGASNRVANALSRQQAADFSHSMMTAEWKLWPQLEKEIATDPLLQKIK